MFSFISIKKRHRFSYTARSCSLVFNNLQLLNILSLLSQKSGLLHLLFWNLQQPRFFRGNRLRMRVRDCNIAEQSAPVIEAVAAFVTAGAVDCAVIFVNVPLLGPFAEQDFTGGLRQKPCFVLHARLCQRLIHKIVHRRPYTSAPVRLIGIRRI